MVKYDQRDQEEWHGWHSLPREMCPIGAATLKILKSALQTPFFCYYEKVNLYKIFCYFFA